jgi:beta-N-acetylhexosaminidase
VSAKSIADRAGGLVLAGFEGQTPADAPVGLLQELAGVILFARNLRSAQQTAVLIAGLQDSATKAGSPPLIVAIDEEGGIVSRLSGIGTTMPSAMALGAAEDPELTHQAYRIVGDELAALGVTLNFAPVADVNTNRANPVIGVRSFGDDPARVGDRVRAAIRGLHDAGVGATAKHFPGHGDASVDSHAALPAIARDLAQLRAVEFPPFRAAMEAKVDAIMTAHVALPLIDPTGLPATLSKPLLTGVLREELGYDGVICTDCLQMAAVAGQYGAGNAAVMAVVAGADLVAFSSSADSVREAVDALRDAIASGRIDAAQVERSLERVGALRLAYRRSAVSDAAALDGVGAEAHKEAALAVARKTVTIVRDPHSLVPLPIAARHKVFLVQFQGGLDTPASTGKQSTIFGKMLARSPARVQEQIRSLDPAGHEYKQLLMAAGSADLIVAVTRRAWAHHLQAQAVVDLALAGKPLVVVASREPYDALAAPEGAAVVATYGDDDASMEAAADVLLGSHRAEGRLPVALTEPSSPHASAASRAACCPSAPIRSRSQRRSTSSPRPKGASSPAPCCTSASQARSRAKPHSARSCPVERPYGPIRRSTWRRSPRFSLELRCWRSSTSGALRSTIPSYRSSPNLPDPISGALPSRSVIS